MTQETVSKPSKPPKAPRMKKEAGDKDKDQAKREAKKSDKADGGDKGDPLPPTPTPKGQARSKGRAGGATKVTPPWAASAGKKGGRSGGLRRASAVNLKVEVPGDADRDALEAVDALMSLSSGYGNHSPNLLRCLWEHGEEGQGCGKGVAMLQWAVVVV